MQVSMSGITSSVLYKLEDGGVSHLAALGISAGQMAALNSWTGTL
jgi:hypothetical protein